MKIVHAAVAALGLMAFAAAPALAGGCSYGQSQSTAKTQSTPATGA